MCGCVFNCSNHKIINSEAQRINRIVELQKQKPSPSFYLTMQLFSIIATLLLFTFKCVSATNEIRFIFNLGLSNTTKAGCHLASEQKMIDDALNSFTGRRSLGLFDNWFEDLYYDEKSKTAYCSNVCAGIASGCCWKKGCIGFRNLRTTDRDLLTCDAEINSIHAKLDEVRNKVTTASCRLFLQKDRRISKCYPQHEYGQIEGMRVWNYTGNDMVVANKPVSPGGSFTVCQNQRFTVESLNEPCVDFGELVLTGPNGYYRKQVENELPLTLFGDNGVQFWTKHIDTTGTYSLTITPDGIGSKTKAFTLKVVKCPGY